jgi:hypothetical protein
MSFTIGIRSALRLPPLEQAPSDAMKINMKLRVAKRRRT